MSPYLIYGAMNKHRCTIRNNDIDHVISLIVYSSKAFDADWFVCLRNLKIYPGQNATDGTQIESNWPLFIISTIPCVLPSPGSACTFFPCLIKI